MVASPQYPYLTPEEYLQMEETSSIKHEYIDGKIYAMAGATDVHVTIALNIASLLRTHLRGSGCRVYIADMKARIESKNRFYYPDVEEYVLINSKKARIECFRRGENGLWILQFYDLDNQIFQLKSINFEENINNIYEEVDFRLDSES
jgi:Uma2 family endonuclease